jgi:hypothetical protein
MGTPTNQPSGKRTTTTLRPSSRVYRTTGSDWPRSGWIGWVMATNSDAEVILEGGF